MTDKAETIVWEKNTETKEVKQITLKQVVGMLNTQNSIEFNDLPYEYFVSRKDIKWATIIGVIIQIAIRLKRNQECEEVATIKC